MMTIITFCLTALACLLAVVVVVLFIEVIAAVASRQRSASPEAVPRPRVAVLVPAHNESSGLLPTLADIKPQLHSGDLLLVVADNCTDNTAAVAAAAGADVVERNDPTRKGKGYALAFGLHKLGLDPPSVVIVIDADCRVGEATIERLAAACVSSQRPAQALNLMVAPDEASTNYRVAEFAWRVKNWARPLGLKALGLSCQLMGTGMAFPWTLIASVDLASGSIVEDLKLGLDLALAGAPAQFCPAARVTSTFPLTAEGAQSQRRRWEQGHIGVVLGALPRLLVLSIGRTNWQAFALALDALVPPLALLALLIIAMTVLAGSAILFGGSPIAFFVCLGSGTAFVAAVLLCWWKYGRDILTLRDIVLILFYVAGKAPLYRQLLSRKRDSQWVRTDRRKF